MRLFSMSEFSMSLFPRRPGLKSRLKVGVLALFAWALSSAGLAATPTGSATPTVSEVSVASHSLPRWSRLKFRARKLVVTADAEVAVGLVASRDTQLRQSATLERALQPQSEQLLEISVSSSMLGRISENVVHLEPDSLAVLQREQLDSKGRQRLKWMRFAHGAAAVHRREPRDASERKLDQSGWSDRSDAIETFPRAGSRTVSEASALFPLLSTLDPGSGEPHKLLIYARRQLNEVDITRVDSRDILASYDVVDARGQATAKSGKVSAIVYQIEPRSLDGSETDFKLLGLEGTIEILLDPELLFPIEVIGRISPVGKVRVQLKEAQLN